MLDRADDAIADLDKLIALVPTSAGAYWLRGAAREMKAEWEPALADYDRSIALAPNPPAVARFLRCQIARRLGRPESTEPLANVTLPRLDPAWMKMLGGFLDGTVPEAELLTSAGQGDANGAAQKNCAAFYHVGMTCLLRGDKARAREFFQRSSELKLVSITIGPEHIAPYVLARAELARLGAL